VGWFADRTRRNNSEWNTQLLIYGDIPIVGLYTQCTPVAVGRGLENKGLSIEQAHTASKMEYLADSDVSMVTWFRRWMTEATDAFRICNTYCFYTAKIVTRTRLDVTLYGRCLSSYFWMPSRYEIYHPNTHTTYICIYNSPCASCSQPTITVELTNYLNNTRWSVQMYKSCRMSYVRVIFLNFQSVCVSVLHTL
jgi:hypothetical protein